MKKNILLSLIMILIIVAVAGCGGPKTERPAPASFDTKKISGELTYEIKDNKLMLKSDANLRDGTIMRFSVESVLGKQLVFEDVTKNGDNLAVQFDLSQISDESVYCFLTAAPTLYGKQPQEVTDAYGKKFENLYSDNEQTIIWTNSEGVIAIFSTGEINLKDAE